MNTSDFCPGSCVSFTPTTEELQEWKDLWEPCKMQLRDGHNRYKIPGLKIYRKDRVWMRHSGSSYFKEKESTIVM